MTGNIDSKLFHNSNRFGSDVPRFCTGALNFEAVSRIVAKQPFSHLTAGRISRAENQNALLHDLNPLGSTHHLLAGIGMRKHNFFGVGGERRHKPAKENCRSGGTLAA
jgi:hypothetical protein